MKGEERACPGGVRALVGVTVLVAALVGLGGCGIPSRTEPVLVEKATDSEPADTPPGQPPGPEGSRDAVDLVERYMQAAAGGNSTAGDRPNAYNAANDRVQRFFLGSFQQEWQKPREVTVVRPIAEQTVSPQPNEWIVTMTLRQIGRLSVDGDVEPSAVSDSLNVPFTVVRTGDQYRLKSAPANLMLLSDEGLKTWYEPNPIYFWESQQDPPKLVADLRYLPKEITAAKRPAEIVGWLKNGPSQWLQSVLQPMPAEVELKDSPVVEGDRVTINLSSKAATLSSVDLSRVAQQLGWSLPNRPVVDLRIEGTKANVSTELSPQNLAVPTGTTSDPERFAVIGKKATAEKPAARPPVLEHELNSEVLAAALTQRKDNAALVRADRIGARAQQRLWLGTRVAGESQSTTYRQTSVVGTALSRPMWIYRPTTRVLIVQDGQLLSVVPGASGTEEARVEQVAIRSRRELPQGGISAFAVAPDGRRIALVVAHRLFVAPLLFGEKLEIGEVRGIVSDLDQVRAVGWGSQTTLIVGGSGGRSANLVGAGSSMFEISIYGTGQTPMLTNRDVLVVDKLVTRPAAPTGQSQAAFVMFEYGGSAFVMFSTSTKVFEVEGAQPSQATNPVAPFYPD